MLVINYFPDAQAHCAQRSVWCWKFSLLLDLQRQSAFTLQLFLTYKNHSFGIIICYRLEKQSETLITSNSAKESDISELLQESVPISYTTIYFFKFIVLVFERLLCFVPD